MSLANLRAVSTITHKVPNGSMFQVGFELGKFGLQRRERANGSRGPHCLPAANSAA
jgi:hypothetical protein